MQKFEEELVDAFVSTFVELDNCLFYTHDRPPFPEFNSGIDPEDWNRIRWSPAKFVTEKSQLRPIYDRLPRRLPKLYEHLALNYRWPEVNLHRIRLKANPPGPDLSGLSREIFNEPAFEGVLIAAGFIPFACGAEGDEWSYDPVCFDLNSLNDGEDCRILRFEHESILCHGRIGEVWQLWPSFEALVADTVNAASGR